MLKTSSAKLTGTPGPSGWSQVHEFSPDDSEKIAKRGHLFAVVSTSKIQDLDLDTIATGRELIARIQEEYYGNLEQKPFNALKSAVEKIVSEFGQSWGDVEVAACSLVGSVVYSVASGGGQVTVSRGGVLGTILRSSGTAVVEASGFPEKGDVILLATKLFHQKVPQGVIKAALESGGAESAIEMFGPEARIGDGAGALGAVVIVFSDNEMSAGVIPQEKTAVGVNLNSLKSSVGKAGGVLSGALAGLIKKIPQRNIYIRESVNEDVASESKKMTFSVAVILLILLFVSIGFGVRQRSVKESRSKYQSILTSAQHDVEEAINLSSISPDKSRELFLESERKLLEIEELKVKDPKIDELRERINESREAILGEYLAEPEMFLDLSLISSGFKGDTVSVSGGQVFILDKEGKKIVSIDIDTKKSRVVAGPGVLDQALDMASYSDRAFVLASDGIYEVGNTKSKVIDNGWQGEALIKSFAGNMYVLDKSGGTIYRYSGQPGGFGSQQVWLASGVSADFSSAKQWVIDGSVYVLFPDSRVLKYSLGSPQNFSIKNVTPEIGTIDVIYANEDVQDIYFLDKAGKRIVVTDKNGRYKAQYKGGVIAEASGVVVSESSKKIIILVGEKLHSIEIKHF